MQLVGKVSMPDATRTLLAVTPQGLLISKVRCTAVDRALLARTHFTTTSCCYCQCTTGRFTSTHHHMPLQAWHSMLS